MSSFGASVVVVLPPDLGRRFLPRWRILSLSRLFSRKFLGVVVVLMVVVVVMIGAGDGFKLVFRKAGITCDLCLKSSRDCGNLELIVVSGEILLLRMEFMPLKTNRGLFSSFS